MSAIPYNLSDQSLTLFIDGAPSTVARSAPAVPELLELIAQDEPDMDRVRRLLDPSAGIREALDGSGVELVGSTVVYKGKRIAGHLEKRILDILAAGLPVDPWKRFVQRVYANPSKNSRDELALFLEAGDLPITPDGHFLAYKMVTDDYRDIRTRTFDNSVGQVVAMEREKVDEDRRKTCSTGLHFCSQEYLHSGFGSQGSRVVIVKIDPADVVSIPADYNDSKGRTWKYEVVGEITFADAKERKAWGVPVETEYEPEDVGVEDEEFDDDELDVILDDAEEFEAVEVEPTFMVAPSKPRKSWWRKLAGS